MGWILDVYIKGRNLNKYFVMDMADWLKFKSLNADLIIADPPFAIGFNGKPSNYNRRKDRVTDGYKEWSKEEYYDNIIMVLKISHKHLSPIGTLLLFSGWQVSSIISRAIEDSSFILQGKMYYAYNFAPYTTKKPSHNVYEIFMLTKGREFYYNSRCSTSHCTNGEKNLALLKFKRDYLKGLPKYPSRFPIDLCKCLIEHFTEKGDLVFDFMAGSGMTVIASEILGRNFVASDINPNGRKVYEALRAHFLKLAGCEPAGEKW